MSEEKEVYYWLNIREYIAQQEAGEPLSDVLLLMTKAHG
jgi:hypothetical protein